MLGGEETLAIRCHMPRGAKLPFSLPPLKYCPTAAAAEHPPPVAQIFHKKAIKEKSDSCPSIKSNASETPRAARPNSPPLSYCKPDLSSENICL